MGEKKKLLYDGVDLTDTTASSMKDLVDDVHAREASSGVRRIALELVKGSSFLGLWWSTSDG